jgi:hypothetical protein
MKKNSRKKRRKEGEKIANKKEMYNRRRRK